MLNYSGQNKRLARELRHRMTEAEQRLWLHLRRDRLGVRFYRQRPLGRYIVDFYAPGVKLAIELDGSQHMDDLEQRRKDALRDDWLCAQGIEVLRFDDRQVPTEMMAVLEVIFEAVGKRNPKNVPSN